MASALFDNGGDDAGEKLEEQGVPALLRELLGLGLLPDDVLAATGRLLGVARD